MGEDSQNIPPLDAVEEFLLETMESLPQQLAEVARQLQQAVQNLEHHAESVESKLETVQRALGRLQNALSYLKQITMALADYATMASVLPPLIAQLRDLVEEGRLDLGFDEVEYGEDS